MRFGSRECTNVVFRAKTNMYIGKTQFRAGQPVLYIDSAKTSTLEGAGTSVYATGGRGNARLITWEGEKTLTFTVEDALLSPLGLSILSGAGLIDNANGSETVHIHKTAQALIEGTSTYIYKIKNDTTGYVEIPLGNSTIKEVLQGIAATGGSYSDGSYQKLLQEYLGALDMYYPGDRNAAIDFALSMIETVDDFPATITENDSNIMRKPSSGSLTIDLTNALTGREKICEDAPIYVVKTEADGSLTNEYFTVTNIDTVNNILTISAASGNYASNAPEAGEVAFIDFYAIAASQVHEIQIDAEHFAGYFYVEADTLFRRQIDGKDMPAIITLPNVKIQSNFSIAMASSGDPSTFSFTMDAMPGYTYFDKTKKVMCVVQVIDTTSATSTWDSVMKHTGDGHATYTDEGSTFEDSKQ